MNYKECKEYKGIPSAYSFKYFDKRILEEDVPVKQIKDDIQIRYEELDVIFEEFFDENSLYLAKQSSKEEREKKGLEDSSYVYGEITFRSLSYIFEFIKYKFGADSINKGNFLDLGSGIGRGIIAASFIHPFEKYVGIEYLENLFNISIAIKEMYEAKLEGVISSNSHLFPEQTVHEGQSTPPVLEIFNGDFLNFDWSKSSVVLANSTCFSRELMLCLSKKADELKAGSFFITFTKKLPELSENWEICEGFRRLMSWGIATIYIHHKIN